MSKRRKRRKRHIVVDIETRAADDDILTGHFHVGDSHIGTIMFKNHHHGIGPAEPQLMAYAMSGDLIHGALDDGQWHMLRAVQNKKELK
jgi:hypothetical protein